MSSILDLNRPVIAFVGRPLDSRKGLSLLFEATETLMRMSGLPPFEVWIVGGSPRESQAISTAVRRIRALENLYSGGRIRVWGRVENAALSELYSRATVTVVPSHFEEFGIVAVEAMMSGCPVVVGSTGGLADIVNGVTCGVRFPADDSDALAGALCGYLRNPERRRIHGARARSHALDHFSSQRTFEAVARLYSPTAPPTGTHLNWTEPQNRPELASAHLKAIRSLLGDDGASASLLSSERHWVYRVQSSGQEYAAKIFAEQPSSQRTVFPCDPEMLPTEQDGFEREVFCADNPIAATIHAANPGAEPILVRPWHHLPADSAGALADERLLKTIGQCRAHRPLGADALKGYLAAVDLVSARRNIESVREFDRVAAQINGRMNNDRAFFSRCHPQVELIRLHALLRADTWPVPGAVQVRWLQVIDLLTPKQALSLEAPQFAHGDLKIPHLLENTKGDLLAVDFEHSRYAVGPLDFGIWLWVTGALDTDDAGWAGILSRTLKGLPDASDRQLCIAWIVSEAIYRALFRLSCGDPAYLALVHRLCRDIPSTVLNAGLIR